MSDTGTSGAPGRYQRSAGGLVGALVILVVVVLVIVGYRELFRTDAAVDPESVDYLDVAGGVAGTGLPVVAPDPLPEEWIATSADLDREQPDRPVWRVGMLTEEERFVGLRQGALTAEQLLEDAYPGEAVEAQAATEVDGPLARSWKTWTVDDELAYTAEVDGTLVLVHGSAGRDGIEEAIARLRRIDPGGSGG